MPYGTPKQLANLKPFRKGESGNARGRTETFPQQLSFARRNSLRNLEVAAELRDDPETPPNVRLAACVFLHERAWGRPKDIAPEVSAGVPALKIEFVTAPQSDQRTINGESRAIEFDPQGK